MENNEKLLGTYPEGDSLMWTFVVYGGSGIISAVLGYLILMWFSLGWLGIIVGPLFLWLFNLMATGWINSKTEYSVIERMGHFYRIVGPGLHWKLPIDRVIADPFDGLKNNRTATTRRRQIVLYTEKYKGDEEAMKDISKHLNFVMPKKIDYENLFGVDTLVTHFGGVGKEDGADKAELYGDIYNFVYRYKNTAGRLAKLADAFIRNTLQRLTIEEANIADLDLWSHSKASEEDKKVFSQGCLEIGWHPEDAPFVLSDNGIPEEAVKATQQAYADKKKGEGALERFRAGTFGPIIDLVKPKKDGGLLGLSKDKAIALFMADKSQNTMEKIQNPTLIVGEGGIPKVLDISGMSKNVSKPSKND